METLPLAASSFNFSSYTVQFRKRLLPAFSCQLCLLVVVMRNLDLCSKATYGGRVNISETDAISRERIYKHRSPLTEEGKQSSAFL